MASIAEKEQLYRQLAGNPQARRIAESALAIEDEEERKEREYPWYGLEWHQIPAQPATLNQLVIDGLLVTGGPRNTYKSRSTTTYKLREPELVRECLEALKDQSSGVDDDIPRDLFDFIIGHEQIKDLLWRSISSVRPVHVLMVGPPATAKTMFLEELGRLPFSRFALGGSTKKGGLEDYLLEFHPRYLILDEVDKMEMRDMSVLLSLMQNGVVARLKKRMREMERMTTWVFGGCNRDDHIWPELKSRFFPVYLHEYSEAEFMQIARAVLISREDVSPELADCLVPALVRYTKDIRMAIHFGRLCKTPADVDQLIGLQWPRSRLY